MTWKKGYLQHKKKTIDHAMKLKEGQKNADHNFDHHAPIRAMEFRTSKWINQLGKDGGDEKHGHAHRTQVCKDARRGKDDHAVYNQIW